MINRNKYQIIVVIRGKIVFLSFRKYNLKFSQKSSAVSYSALKAIGARAQSRNNYGRLNQFYSRLRYGVVNPTKALQFVYNTLTHTHQPHCAIPLLSFFSNHRRKVTKGRHGCSLSYKSSSPSRPINNPRKETRGGRFNCRARRARERASRRRRVYIHTRRKQQQEVKKKKKKKKFAGFFGQVFPRLFCSSALQGR